MREYCQKIKESDIILVCNFDKKWITWYLWMNTLMEMWMALYDNKAIYLLNTPSQDLPSYEEVMWCKPIIINWDFSLLV